MNRTEKKRFMRELSANVVREAMLRVPERRRFNAALVERGL